MMMIKRNQGDLLNFNNFIDDIFNNDLDVFSKMRGNVPAVNILENNESFVIEVAAPGLTKDKFDIDLDNNVLTISANTEDEKVEESDKNYTRKEFDFSNFKRVFTLPDSANKEDVSANYNSGVLCITIKKKDEAVVKPKRKIDIQ